MVIGSWSDLQPLLDRHKKKMHGKAYHLYYDSVPNEISTKIKKLIPSEQGELEGLGKDQVLDRETVQKYVA
jgi:hypothetical protein